MSLLITALNQLVFILVGSRDAILGERFFSIKKFKGIRDNWGVGVGRSRKKKKRGERTLRRGGTNARALPGTCRHLLFVGHTLVSRGASGDCHSDPRINKQVLPSSAENRPVLSGLSLPSQVRVSAQAWPPGLSEGLKQGSANFFVKDQTANVLGFVDHTAQCGPCSVKAAIDDDTTK